MDYAVYFFSAFVWQNLLNDIKAFIKYLLYFIGEQICRNLINALLNKKKTFYCIFVK